MRNDPPEDFHPAIIATARALADYEPAALRIAASAVMDEIFSTPLASVVEAEKPRLGQAKQRLRNALAGSDEPSLRHAAEFFCWALRECVPDRVPVAWPSIDSRRRPENTGGFEVTIPIDDPSDFANIVWVIESLQGPGVRDIAVMDDHSKPHISLNFADERSFSIWSGASAEI